METLFSRIKQAHAGIRPQVPVTPLEYSSVLSAALDCEVWLKCDHQQPTGSFKVRGATNKLRTLGASAQATGVTTASTGNYGMAVAYAGKLAKVPVTVYLPASAVQTKKDAIGALGAKLIIVDGAPIDAELQARRDGEAQGMPYMPPYNDLDVMAGQGTIGMEMFEQAPDLDAVFIATGGGGLIGGAGAALKGLQARAQVVGVWPENSPCLLRALEAGRIIDVPEYPTLSDATAGAIEAGSVTFPVCQEVIDERITVNEAEIASAMRRVALSDRWIVEGAAGAALAGLVKQAHAYRGRKVAVVLCGRNIALESFLAAIAKA
jgi:threonine dehydratase